MSENIPLNRARQALRLTGARLPYLAGLTRVVRLRVSESCQVAAIGPTGLILINPTVFRTTPISDLMFVLAHELLHLALDTFGRAGESDRMRVNVAHDWVINDTLRDELSRPIPLGGLDRPGARKQSLESLLATLNREFPQKGLPGCWVLELEDGADESQKPTQAPIRSALQIALESAGLVPPGQGGAIPPPPPSPSKGKNSGDLLSAEEEAALEPQLSEELREQMRKRVRREAVRSVNLREIQKALEKSEQQQQRGTDPGDGSAFVEAAIAAYRPPWELALQHWLDSVGPGQRTYSRANRRGHQETVILPGRRREGWTLHIVLDTSGSMSWALSRALGLIAAFCEGAGVSDVHILQCDTVVTRDEWIDVSALSRYQIVGFGGSDMSPAMLRLAEDNEVSAVLVLTDGAIGYPVQEPPYETLWAVLGNEGFVPPYGNVVHVRL